MTDSVSLVSNSAAQRDIEFHLHQQTNPRHHEETGPSIIARGDGCFVVDSEGRRLFEGMSGLWCASLGFSEQRLANVAAEQMKRLPYYQNFRGTSNNPLIDLSEMLVNVAPEGLTKAIFQSSGSEANDMAFKLVWYYFNSIDQPRKKKIISRWGGYHGTSISAGSATGLPIMHESFDLPIARFLKVSNPHFYRYGKKDETEAEFSARLVEEIDQLIQAEGPDTVAAFIAEPMMASAGVVTPPCGYFDGVQKVLKKHGVLFIADEVVCGFGRTGNYWGCDTFGIKPDILTCAKAMTSAYFPMSATLISDEIYEGIKIGGDKIGVLAHGYTYGGHPVGAAIACETIRIYDEMDIVSRVRELMPVFWGQMEKLSDHPLVGEVRGVGLCGALEIVSDKIARSSYSDEVGAANLLAQCARDHGVIVRPIGQSIAFAPPLISKEQEIKILFEGISDALDDLTKKLR